MSRDYMNKVAALISTAYVLMGQAEEAVFKATVDIEDGDDGQLAEALCCVSSSALADAALRAASEGAGPAYILETYPSFRECLTEKEASELEALLNGGEG